MYLCFACNGSTSAALWKLLTVSSGLLPRRDVKETGGRLVAIIFTYCWVSTAWWKRRRRMRKGVMSHSTKPATMEATSSFRCDFYSYLMSAGGARRKQTSCCLNAPQVLKPCEWHFLSTSFRHLLHDWRSCCHPCFFPLPAHFSSPSFFLLSFLNGKCWI